MSIRKILKDPEIKATVNVRIFGSILVALSGLILFSDKVISVEFENNFGFNNTATLIWMVSQTLSPLILAFAFIFKPFKTSYLVPIYIYTIQLYWVFDATATLDNPFLQTYAIGTCCVYLLLGYVIYKVKIFHNKERIQNERFYTEVHNTLDVLKSKIIEKV